jgi:hypothetical protein
MIDKNTKERANAFVSLKEANCKNIINPSYEADR